MHGRPRSATLAGIICRSTSRTRPHSGRRLRPHRALLSPAMAAGVDHGGRRWPFDGVPVAVCALRPAARRETDSGALPGVSAAIGSTLPGSGKWPPHTIGKDEECGKGGPARRSGARINGGSRYGSLKPGRHRQADLFFPAQRTPARQGLPAPDRERHRPGIQQRIGTCGSQTSSFRVLTGSTRRAGSVGAKSGPLGPKVRLWLPIRPKDCWQGWLNGP